MSTLDVVVPLIPRIVITVGLPGSGKSTWLADRGIIPLSSDEMRRLLLDDEDDQSHPEKIFEALRYLLEVRLRLGRLDNHVDATHLQRMYRRPYFELAARHGARVEAFFFDVTLETCLERNRLRKRRVPESVLREMAMRLEPPALDEGFARVVRFREDPLRGGRC